jgi:hypothetical protein
MKTVEGYSSISLTQFVSEVTTIFVCLLEKGEENLINLTFMK